MFHHKSVNIKSGAILSAQNLSYAKYLSKKKMKPFSGCPHLMHYSMLYWLAYLCLVRPLVYCRTHKYPFGQKTRIDVEVIRGCSDNNCLDFGVFNFIAQSLGCSILLPKSVWGVQLYCLKSYGVFNYVTCLAQNI